jgi:alpha-beta hydrolase superfamily lysophospholipase
MSPSQGSSGDGNFEAKRAAESSSASHPPAAGVRFSEGRFERGRGLSLYHCEFVPDRVAESHAGALVVVMHGYAEHCRRYDEVARHLAGRGHVVCSMDARGHGRSQGQRGYVRAYEDYVDDFAAFVARARANHGARPLVVLGHSNGGLIAVRAVQAGLAGARGLILTSPLFGLQKRRKAVPDGVARALSALVPRLPAPNGIRSEDLTHDPALREAHRRDPWVHRVATSRWYWSMTLAARRALAEAQRVTLPLAVVQAELDPMVDTAIIAEFHARAGSTDKLLVVRRGELHEVLNETARLELFAMLGDWIERVTAR